MYKLLYVHQNVFKPWLRIFLAEISSFDKTVECSTTHFFPCFPYLLFMVYHKHLNTNCPMGQGLTLFSRALKRAETS